MYRNLAFVLSVVLILALLIGGFMYLMGLNNHFRNSTANDSTEFSENTPVMFRVVVARSDRKLLTVYNIDGTRYCAWTPKRLPSDTSAVAVGDTLNAFWVDRRISLIRRREHEKIEYASMEKFQLYEYQNVVHGVMNIAISTPQLRRHIVVLELGDEERGYSYVAVEPSARSVITCGDTLRFMPYGFTFHAAQGQMVEWFYPPIELSRHVLFAP